MPTDGEHIGEIGNQTLETKVKDAFNNFNLDENQTKRLTKCIEIQLNNGKKNEKLIIKRLKKIIEGEINPEEGIKKIENELKEIETSDNNIKNLNQEVIQNNQEVIQNNQGIEDGKEKIEKQAKKVSESFSKLDNQYKSYTQQELEQKKSTLPEDTKKKLAENNINEDEYIQYTISRDKITELGTNDNTPETRDFLKSLKDLEDNLGIRRETAKGLPLAADTATFEANPELKNFKETNSDIARLNNTSYFGKEKINVRNTENLRFDLAPYKKMENLYKDDEKYPKDDKRFNEISQKITEEKYSEITNDDYKYYTTKLDNLNGWITDYITSSAAQAPLTGVLRYLDSYSGFNKDTLADRFKKGKDEYITMEDTTMRIEGVIDGNPLSFYYNVKDGETKISCDDVLHIDGEKYEIYNGEGEYPKSDLKINMPSIKDIVNNLQNIDQDTYKKLLEQSNDLGDFQSKITELINNKIKSTFPDNDKIKTRMARFTEKNLTAQAFDTALIGNKEYKDKINTEGEDGLTPIKKVLLLVDNTTERSTSSDLVELKGAFNKLKELISKSYEEIDKIRDPILRGNLHDLKQGQESRNYDLWKDSITTFFTLFERRDPKEAEYQIDIDDFTSFIELGFKDEETRKETLENFTPEFQEKYNMLDPEEAARRKAKEEAEKKAKEKLLAEKKADDELRESAEPELDAKLLQI